MKLDLTRWPLLLGASLCIATATYILLGTDDRFDEIFAAIILLVIGAFLTGAFVADLRRRDE